MFYVNRIDPEANVLAVQGEQPTLKNQQSHTHLHLLLRNYQEKSNEITADARQSPVNGNSKNVFDAGPCEAKVELLEMLFSEQSVQRIYNEEQLRSRVPS
jgi:hypothetical protein